MCPFCIGAAAWAAAGIASAGGLGVLAAVVQRRGSHEGAPSDQTAERTAPHEE